MSTILSRQLETFRGHRGFDAHRRATLLHDARTAAQFTSEDVFDIGLEGFNALCEMDHRFESFRATLFFGVPKEREQKTVEELTSTNRQIFGFLRVLMDYFTYPPATKALEHLVRSYKIHLFNVDDCMACCLPYHVTLEFQNFIQIMDLKETQWYWLEDVQKSGIPLSRGILIKRCISDHAVLSFLCTMATNSSNKELTNTRVLPFFAVLVCELLDQVEEVSEDLMRPLVSVIADGLHSKASVDFRKATFMIIAQLCTKAVLSEKTIEALLQSLLAFRSHEDNNDRLIIVCHIYKTQEQFERVPENFIELLSRMQNCGEALAGLMEKGLDATRFVSILFPKLLKKCISRQNQDFIDLMMNLILHVPCSEHIAQLASKLFHHVSAKGASSVELLRPIIQTLDVQYPLLLDEAVDSYLKSDVNDQQKTLVLSLFYGTSHEMLHTPLHGLDSTLLAAVDAPSSHAQKIALEKLIEVMENGEVGDETSRVVKGLFLRKLEDEDFETASLATKVKMEVIEDMPALSCVLLKLLDRCMEKIHTHEDEEAVSTALRIVEKLQSHKNGIEHILKDEEVCLKLLEYVFPYCLAQLPVSVKIGTLFSSSYYPVASIISQKLDSLPCEIEGTQEPHFNKLIELMLCNGNEGKALDMILPLLGEKCGPRVSSFALLAIQRYFALLDKPDSGHFPRIMKHLMPRMESLNEESVDDAVSLVKGHIVSYRKTLLDTVTKSLENKNEPVWDRRTIEILILQILRLASIDRDRVCCKASMHAFSHNIPIAFFLNVLVGSSFEVHVPLVTHGLEIVESCLDEDTLSKEDYIASVLSVLALLGEGNNLVRQSTIRIMKILTEVLKKIMQPSSQAFTSLFQFLLHHEKLIEMDPKAIITLLAQMFTQHYKVVHKSKRLKTDIIASVNASECTLIKTHFLTHLGQLASASHHKELLIIVKSLRQVVEDQELFHPGTRIVEVFLEESDFFQSGQAVELVSRIVQLFSPGLMHDIQKEDQSFDVERMTRIFLDCLEKTGEERWNQIRYSCLKQIHCKWVKSKKLTHFVNTAMFEAVVCIMHRDKNFKNHQLASEIAQIWPIKNLNLDSILNVALEDDPLKQEQCLWVLEVLGERTEFPHTNEWTHSLQELLRSLLNKGLNEGSGLISRMTLSLLESIIKSEKEGSHFLQVDMEILIGYLRQSTDALVQKAVLSLLQLIAAKNPAREDSSMIQILKILANQFTRQEEEVEVKKMVEALQSIVQSWMQTGQSSRDIWIAMTPSLLHLNAQKRTLVCQALLGGMKDCQESLSAGLVVLWEEFVKKQALETNEWGTFAQDLCSMVNLSERNHAFALLIQSCTYEESIDAGFLLSLVELTCEFMKMTILSISLSHRPSLEVSEGLGYTQLLIQSIKKLSHIRKLEQQDRSKKHKLRSLKKSLHQLNASLKKILDFASYLVILVGQLGAVEDDSELALILEFLRRRLNELEETSNTGELRISSEVLRVCPLLSQLMESKQFQTPENLQLLLATIQPLVHALGSQYPESFSALLPLVSTFTQKENGEVRASAFACMAAFLREMGPATMQHLPQFMPEVLNSIQSSLEDDDEDIALGACSDLESGLELISAAIEGFGNFLSPYIDQILKSLIHPKMGQFSPLRNSIVEILPKHVPVRLLLPPLLALHCKTSEIILHLQLVHGMIMMMNNSVATQFLDPLLSFFYKALDVRQTQDQTSDVEGLVIEAFLTFVMKLSEKQFRPIFQTLMDWALLETSSNPVIGRQITLFRLLGELTRKLKSLFIGYHAVFVDKALEILKCKEKEEEEEKRNKRKDKKKKQELHVNKVSYLLDYYISRSLYRALLYDEEDTFSPDIIKKLISVAIKQIQIRQSPSHHFSKLPNEEHSEITFKGIDSCKDDSLSIIWIGLLIQISLRKSSFQKSLNHKVLKACSKCSTYGRYLCLCVVRELVLRLKDQYRVLIPESIPLLVEMLEVDDGKVQKTAKEIIKLMEDLNSEG